MTKGKCWAKFKFSDVSKGLPTEMKRALFSVFELPMKLPKDGPKFMSLEEFIMYREYGKDE